VAVQQECVDPDCRRSLKALSDLYALRCIESDMLFRNEDYIAPAKAKAVQRLMVDLCSELR
jgi:acyl-CoA oxidase